MNSAITPERYNDLGKTSYIDESYIPEKIALAVWASIYNIYKLYFIAKGNAVTKATSPHRIAAMR